MKYNAKQLARAAFIDSAKLRLKLKIPLENPINSLDIVDKLGIEVRLQALPSLEGLYIQKENQSVFILSSLRPIGRINFNCVHELGHFYYGHGTSVDSFFSEGKTEKRDEKELQADLFASFMLMPDLAVKDYLNKARITLPEQLTPLNAYKMATYFRVGFTTLLSHLTYSLGLIDKIHFNKLIKMKPKQIKSELLEEDFSGLLIMFDDLFFGCPIDLRIDDIVFLPNIYSIEGNLMRIHKEERSGKYFKAKKVGICRIVNNTNEIAVFLRVSNSNYEGRSIYRHLESEEE
ncbi:ImmA/IrrE family metallo-endopeptidase [Leptospira bourretii]|uniref:ImmA/IrrE family metallo-endopeptidase n=1 Tax=Leptospira bourretii TaxID=2484962 RepID=UPI001090B4E7|nr:ImmA/IrrE family metallo-endopeptidase [Leptospira bourretii]TGL18566.1 ImmA/IrrE family metallo-endopeptidase [Leptospira bourretii]